VRVLKKNAKNKDQVKKKKWDCRKGDRRKMKKGKLGRERSKKKKAKYQVVTKHRGRAEKRGQGGMIRTGGRQFKRTKAKKKSDWKPVTLVPEERVRTEGGELRWPW